METPRKPRRWGDSVFLKLLTLGCLILVLLIPVVRIMALINERLGRESQVRNEITQIWGAAQTLVGPVITVPYEVFHEQVTVRKVANADAPLDEREIVERTRHSQRHRLHLLPAELSWSGVIEPEVRYRGIFQVVVYEAKIQARGSFDRADLEAAGIEPESFDWQNARLGIGVTEVRGLRGRAEVRWGEGTLELLPGSQEPDLLGAGVHAVIPEWTEDQERIPFAFDLTLRGAESFEVAATGEETRLDLTSSWNDPSFSGAYLPDEREIAEAGFSAQWQIPYFGRSYPQRFYDDEVSFYPGIEQSTFGVRLVLPADQYQQTERAVKYAVLFLVLTFGTFFLLEVVSPVRLHAMQYLLVGFALCLFYVVLLALAEQIGFSPAYLLASLATSGLIAGYARSILASRRFALLVLGALWGLYCYLFVLLQLEDYALLLGALGLFAVLALVMRLTRNLDWHTLKFRPRTVLPPSPDPEPL